MACLKSFLFLFFAGLLYIAAIAFAGLTARPTNAELAVVLGNEILKDGSVSRRLAARLDCALALYRKQTVQKIMVSGGVGKSGYDEATVMADYLLRQGVTKDDIVVDSLGVNTMATAFNTAKYVAKEHVKGVVAVSQYYHLPRTIMAMRRAGIKPLSAAAPRYFELFDIYAILREGVAIPVYLAKMPRKE